MPPPPAKQGFVVFSPELMSEAEMEVHTRKLLKEGALDCLLHVLTDTRDPQCVLTAAMLLHWMSHARVVLRMTGTSACAVGECPGVSASPAGTVN